MTAERLPLAYRLKEAMAYLRDAIASLDRRLPAEKGLDTLTPVRLKDSQSERYEQELLLAMVDPQVRNIAITGGYGAGKSSLIRTFKEKHRGFTYAAVSLATFRNEGVIVETADETDDRPPEEKEKEKERAKRDDHRVTRLINRIEETIVQQLLYAVPASKLPRTRLKRIMQPEIGRVAWGTFLLSLAAVASARLYLIAAFPPRTLAVDWLTSTLLWIPATLALVLACSVAVFGLFKVVKSLSLLNIDGWSIKGGTIESMQHSSVLHKNVDEIIYCFQNSRIDVVVIEDLDRFGIQDVFFRLREINSIINEAPQIKRKVRFVYALNDELFAGSEKTKFFDFVLPIVPVINKENSHAKMIDGLQNRLQDGKSFASRIDNELVETISYRIDDMRLVKNIVNEMDVFAHVLAKDMPLAWNKLFAIIVLKNLHSKQYWQLSKRTGFLYNLISGYPAWRNHRAEEVRAEIDQLERLALRKQNDVARSQQELRAGVWFRAQVQAGASTATHLYQGGTPYSLPEFLEDEAFTNLVSSNSTLQFAVGNGRTGQHVRLSDIVAEMDYESRFTAIVADDADIRAKIAEKQIALRDAHKIPLEQALVDGYQADYAEDLNENETIRYLLVQGHLDEDYADYLGHFYGHAIGSEDMKLIFALRQGEECDVAVAIKEPEKFVKKLSPRNIDRGRGFIAELLLYLARSFLDAPMNTITEILVRILDDAPAYPQRFVDAVDILIERHEEATLLRAIYHLRATLFSLLLKGLSAPGDGPKSSHVVAMLRALDLDQLERLHHVDGSIKDRIQMLGDASDLVTGLDASGDGWQWLKGAGVRFGHLEPGTSPEVLSALVEADALSPGIPMLQLLALNGGRPGAAVVPVTVSRLLAADRIEGIEAFVAAHMRPVVARLLEQDVALKETAATVLMVLKVLASDGAMASRYFERTSCSFPTLSALPRALWDSAMRGDRLDNPVDAVHLYEALRPRVGAGDAEEVDEGTIRVILRDYATRHAELLGTALWTETDTDERLQEWIVTDPDLDEVTTSSLLAGTVVTSPSLLSEAVSDQRLDLLIRRGHVALSEAIWAVIATRPLATQAAYLAPTWEHVRLTPIEAQVDFALAARLDADGVLSIDDALRIFAARAGVLSDEFRPLVGSLAGRAAAAGLAFPAPLIDVAAHLLQPDNDDARYTRDLLLQAMPVLTWPQASAALRSLGGDLAKLRAGRSVEVELADGLRELLEALRARGFASSLTPGKKGTKVNMKRKL